MENLIQAEDAIRQLQNFKLGGNVLRVKNYIYSNGDLDL
jgi:hypothetical protein